MRLLAVFAAVLLALIPTAGAQERRVDPLDLEDEVMCVSCNQPLFVAESVQADRQRALIRRYADQGLTKDEIKARLVVQYGEDVLAMPRNDGTGLAAKVVPVVAVAALLVGLAFLLPRWRRRRPTAALRATGDAPVASDAELARLDEDLRRGG